MSTKKFAVRSKLRNVTCSSMTILLFPEFLHFLSKYRKKSYCWPLILQHLTVYFWWCNFYREQTLKRKYKLTAELSNPSLQAREHFSLTAKRICLSLAQIKASKLPKVVSNGGTKARHGLWRALLQRTLVILSNI